MAKAVSDLLIKLGVAGIEDVNQLKSSLRSLSQSLGPTDKGLEKVRNEILEFASASKRSTQTIRGVIESFKGLKQQATIGSTIYRTLGKDVESLTKSLDRLIRKEDEAANKPRTAKQIFNTGSVAVFPEKFKRQIAAGNELLQGLKVTSQEYGRQLAAITVRTQEFTRAQQRQQVVAANLAAANRAGTTGFLQSSRVNIENTNTISALKQKISELSQDVENLDVGSQAYTTTSRQLKDAQEELNQVLGASSKAFDDLTRAQERSERRAKKIAGIQSASAGAIGTRNPRTGAMIAGGSAPPLSKQKFKAPEIKQVSRSYEEVANNIRKVSVASNGSIRSLEKQRNSWSSLRAGLDPASEGYRQAGREIDRVEKKLSKLNKTSGSKAKNAARGAGAVISGGMFGGPEGALGALGGFALGGVEGAIGGGVIGSQVREIRRAIGATADYSAQIQKLEIGLRGVVSSEAEFHQAIAVAKSATKDFNITAIDSISGVTKLSAAVIGAGGNLTDVEIVFRGISSAVLATGGSADDVRSAITAMVQVFSKGKVSAEELSGQLGERLPGAVVRFAKAAFGTGPEAMQKLQKELKNGTVGLNELMLFAKDSGLEFEELAKKVASSSASAGARLNILVDAFRLELGTAIQPIGAQIQDFTGEVLVEFKDEIIALAKELGKFALALLELAKFVADNKEIVGFFAGLALKIKAAQLAIAAFAGIKTSFAGVVAAGTSAKITGDVAQTSAGKVTIFKNALSGLAKLGIITVGIHLLTKGLNEIRNFEQQRKKIKEGIEDPAAQFKGMYKEQVEERQSKMRKEAAGLRAQTAEDQNRSPMEVFGDALETFLVGPGLQQIFGRKTGLNKVRDAELRKGRLIEIKEALKVDPSKFAARPKQTVFDLLNPDGKDGGTDTTQARIDRADEIVRKLQDQVNIQEAKSKVGEFLEKQAKERSDLEAEFQALLKDGADKEIEKAQAAAVGLLDKKQALELEKRTKEAMDKATKPLEDMNKSLQEKIRYDKEYKRLIAEGVNPELAEQLIKINELFEAGDRQLEQKLLDLEAEKSKTGLGEQQLQNINDQIAAIQRRRAALKGDKADAEGSAGEVYADPSDPSFMDNLRKGLNDLYNEATNLNKLISETLVSGVNSFADAFVEFAMTGKASFAELTASILRDLARIIIKAAILQVFKGILPDLFGAKGAVTKGMIPPGTIPGGIDKVAANGLAVAKNGIVPYAKGGLVTKPTLFQYKQGGVGNYGLMGEAGTEAIMPLRRGANGKLGVEASGGGVGSVVVNVDASGSSVEGSADQAAQLGKAIGVAVQQELIKQKRPGGLLTV